MFLNSKNTLSILSLVFCVIMHEKDIYGYKIDEENFWADLKPNFKNYLSVVSSQTQPRTDIYITIL